MIRKVDVRDRFDEIQIGEKTYKIDVTNYDFIKKCQKYVNKLNDLTNNLKTDDSIDNILNVSKEVINFALDNDFEYVWEVCGHNFKNVINVIETLSLSIKDGMNIKSDKYV